MEEEDVQTSEVFTMQCSRHVAFSSSFKHNLPYKLVVFHLYSSCRVKRREAEGVSKPTRATQPLNGGNESELSSISNPVLPTGAS